MNIQLQELTKRFPARGRKAQGEVTAVQDLTFEVPDGMLVGLLGPSGCGKSTTLNMICGLETPTAGKILFGGEDVTNLPPELRGVGMVFQNPDNQIVATVVEEDVAFALENLGVPPAEIRSRIDEAMDMAGIAKHKHKAPHKLSGGQKQRVAIAGVIAMRPDCLILDEATAMLDPIGREKVMKTIRHLNKDFGITVVAITHYMEEAAQADRIVVMNKGKVVLEGTPKEVFSQVDLLHSLRLDVPQATELAQQLRAAGLDMPKDCITEEECAQALAKLLA